MFAHTGSTGYNVNSYKIEIPEAAQLCFDGNRDIEWIAKLDCPVHPGRSRGAVGCINGIGDVFRPGYLGGEKLEQFFRFRVNAAGQLNLLYHLICTMV